MVYGYIRVSTREQKEDRQRTAMRKAGVPERNIFYGQAVRQGF